MTIHLRYAFALALALACGRDRSGAPAGRGGDTIVGGSVETEQGRRDYQLFVPAGAEGKEPRPLLVMLHGCFQDAASFMTATGMNALAAKEGFLVLYPEQSEAANEGRCWHWFETGHQQRGQGEPALIAGAVAHVAARYRVDPSRTWVAGFSAGGAMAVIMAATYPDLFRALGVSAGLEYGASSSFGNWARAAYMGGPDPDLQGKKAFEAMGGQVIRAMPTIVFHGAGDGSVRPVNGEQIFAQWAQTNDLLDDGMDNGSVDLSSAHEQSMEGIRGLAFSVRRVTGAGGRPLLEHWVIEGMGHAWSGGSGKYADPRGPDASAEMLRIFGAGTANE
jgi:poly(hydroxyalkanoate) depolymerase family esterase